MGFKGTLAPWVVADDVGFNANHSGSRYHYIAAGKGLYDDFSNTGFDLAGIMSIHDAHLIAAAPELLEALMGLVEYATQAIDGLGDLQDGIDTAKAAIAKALGQQ